MACFGKHGALALVKSVSNIALFLTDTINIVSAESTGAHEFLRR